MDSVLLKQVGQLLLGSVPTIIFFLLLFFAYTVLVHKPLHRVLAERYSRTQGAMQRAQADIAAAEAKTAEYEQRLREARVGIFKQQEARRNQALQLREKGLADARGKADQMVREAKGALARDTEAARANLQTQAEALAAEVVRSILRPVATPNPVAGGRA